MIIEYKYPDGSSITVNTRDIDEDVLRYRVERNYCSDCSKVIEGKPKTKLWNGNLLDVCDECYEELMHG